MRIILIVLATLLEGCLTTTPYLNITNLAEVDFSDKDFSEGTSCATYVLGFIGPFGKSSIPNAAKAGNLKSVQVVDSTVKNFILFQKICTTAYGIQGPNTAVHEAKSKKILPSAKSRKCYEPREDNTCFYGLEESENEKGEMTCCSINAEKKP